MTPRLRRWLFETLYRNKYLYRFASTVPFAGQWRTWQRQIFPRLQGHDILELGCGLGDLLADMLTVGYTCHAVEHSPQMSAAARETLQKRGVGSPHLVIQGSAQKLPFAPASFDTVVSTFPSEYIYDLRTIEEVVRVLRPGGRLIVIEGASLLPRGFLQPLLLLLQSLVYGPATFRHSRARSSPRRIPVHPFSSDPLSRASFPGSQYINPNIVTERVAYAAFGRLIPLERTGLQRQAEIARSPRWEVFITIGVKAGYDVSIGNENAVCEREPDYSQ